MTHKRQKIQHRFLHDNNGNIVVFQRPNWLMLSWLAVTIVWLTGLAGKHSSKLFGLGAVILAAWAVLEILRGTNYFRRLLGLAVLIGLGALAPFIWSVISGDGM